MYKSWPQLTSPNCGLAETFSLFLEEMPDAGGKDFIEALNPESLQVVNGYVEPSLAQARADEKFQFERHGYFVADRVDHRTGGRLVFNRVTGLKDSWAK